MTDAELKAMVKSCAKVLKGLGYKADGALKTIKFNGRLSRALGRCRRRLNLSTRQNEFTLDFSTKYMNYDISEKEKRALVFHELIHTIDGCYNHGKKFNMISSIIEKKEDLVGIVGTSTKTPDDYKKTISKYKIVCEDCDLIMYRSRRMSHIDFYRCGKCKGKIHQMENKDYVQ